MRYNHVRNARNTYFGRKTMRMLEKARKSRKKQLVAAGESLLSARIKSGLSATVVAKRLGVLIQTVRAVESAQYRPKYGADWVEAYKLTGKAAAMVVAAAKFERREKENENEREM